MDDLEQRMKDKLLEGLIEHMEGRMGDDLGAKFPKKAMEVSVAAPDQEHLVEGLGHAQEMAGEGDESDEDKLMKMFGEDDEDDKEA